MLEADVAYTCPYNYMSPESRGKTKPTGSLSRNTPPTLRSSEALQQGGNATQAKCAAPVTKQATYAEGSKKRDESDGEEEQDNENYNDGLLVEELEASDVDHEEQHLPARHPPYTPQSHSHLPRQTTTALFPPFYNRPPTPLPASPSLTSLLRPPFASRRTTPESSDAELPAGLRVAHNGSSTPSFSTTNLVTSAKHAPTVPRAAPKVPTYEYYGFALYLGSSVAFLGYILWAYVPAPMLHQMGIYYYPNRWWALAIPCWLIMLIIYIYAALASYNTGYLTLPLHSIENLVDETAQVAVVDPKTGEIVRTPISVTDKLHEKDQDKGMRATEPGNRRTSFSAYQFHSADGVNWKEFWSVGTDAVMDVPIGGVCEILYGHED